MGQKFDLCVWFITLLNAFVRLWTPARVIAPLCWKSRFTGVLIWNGSMNFGATSYPTNFLRYNLGKNIFRLKFYCVDYRYITYVKISLKRAIAMALIFLFCLSVLSSKKLWNCTGKGEEECVVSSCINESCALQVSLIFYMPSFMRGHVYHLFVYICLN